MIYNFSKLKMEGGAILKFFTVRIFMITSVISLLLWMSALIYLMFDRTNVEAGEIEVQNDATIAKNDNDTIQIVALGDSLTRGTGDSFGKGYIGHFIDLIKERTDKDINVTNLAVKGLRSPQLLELVQQKEVQRQLGQASIIMMTIGGNDLFQSGETLIAYDEKKVEEIKEQFLHNLQSILSTIRSVNTESPIYFIGLYNPFIDLDHEIDTAKTVLQWNYDTVQILTNFAKTVFVPTYDLFQLRYNELLYTDHFHPNNEGYRLLAERLNGLVSFEESD